MNLSTQWMMYVSEWASLITGVQKHAYSRRTNTGAQQPSHASGRMQPVIRSECLMLCCPALHPTTVRTAPHHSPTLLPFSRKPEESHQKSK